MSRRRGQSGFTLLELQVGLLLLTLVVVGFTRLVDAQEQLVGGLEGWCKDDPVLYIVPPADPHERAAGMPAALIDMPKSEPTDWLTAATESVEKYANTLEIQSIERTLSPPQAKAVVQVNGPSR